MFSILVLFISECGSFIKDIFRSLKNGLNKAKMKLDEVLDISVSDISVDEASVSDILDYKYNNTMTGLTSSKENCIKIIYSLMSEQDGVAIDDIASEIHISDEEVLTMVNNLESKGFVHTVNQLICLTYEGLHAAENVTYNYEIVLQYIISTVGLNKETASKVACSLEHVLDYSKVEELITI